MKNIIEPCFDETANKNNSKIFLQKINSKVVYVIKILIHSYFRYFDIRLKHYKAFDFFQRNVSKY